MTAPLMRRLFSMALLLALLPLLLSAQQKPNEAPPAQGERDLKTIKPGGTAATAGDLAPVTIPRSYALVVGISHYANLPQSAQLHYPGRDAEEMYTTLISPEGGQFPPENVHRLIDREATLANIKKNLSSGCPR